MATPIDIGAEPVMVAEDAGIVGDKSAGDYTRWQHLDALLAEMDVDELERVEALAREALGARRAAGTVHTFTFEATNDPRKGIPFVAKLFWNFAENKLDREFYSLDRVYGRKTVTVAGTYSAQAGDIIEKRTGGSWKNDYRAWYVVLPDGTQEEVSDISSSAGKLRVQQYLKGAIDLDALRR